jgi:hypothetical protein
MPTENGENQKIGAGILKAYGRMGLGEARTFLNPFQGSPIVQPTDYGMWGMATPGEVADARREESKELEEEPLLAHVRSSRDDTGRDDRGRDDRGTDRD